MNTFTQAAGSVKAPLDFARISSMDLGDLPAARMFSTSDGHQMAFRRHRATGMMRANLAVVLVHGAGCFGDQLHVMASAIAARCSCDVYTLDMRGHGLSEGDRGHAVRHSSEMVRDIAEFVRAVRAQPSAPRVVVGGHSAGGGVVLNLARSRAAADVAGFLFIAPFLGLGSGVDRPHFGGWVALRSWRLRMLFVANLFGITLFNNMRVIDFNMAAAAPDRRYVPHWSFSTLMAFGMSCWSKDRAPIDSSKPVLVVAGSADECFVQPLYGDAFASIAPHASIPSVGAVGHWDILVDPAALAETTRWLGTFLEVSMPELLPLAPSPRHAAEGAVEDRATSRARQWRARLTRVGAVPLLLLFCQGRARAQQALPAAATSVAADRVYVRLGAAGLIFEPDSKFTVQGQRVAGAQTGLSSSATLSGEAGYHLTPHLSLSVTGGLPPRTHITGEGTIAPYGLLGSSRYGTLVGLLDYHFNLSSRLQPWIGIGPALLLVLSSKGAAIQNLSVDNRVGVALQVGADYMLSQHWGVFASATQNFVGTEAHGNFGPYSVRTKVTLNPVALQAGVELRF